MDTVSIIGIITVLQTTYSLFTQWREKRKAKKLAETQKEREDQERAERALVASPGMVRRSYDDGHRQFGNRSEQGNGELVGLSMGIYIYYLRRESSSIRSFLIRHIFILLMRANKFIHNIK
jgi:hypothetical protein